jgi:hypothetical protein
MASTVSLALHYGLRLDAAPEFIQGYADGMRLDQRGQGVACGKSWIPRSKKCSRDKASQTSQEAKARTVEKSKARAKLKGEVKAAKGQKARVKDEKRESDIAGSMLTLTTYGRKGNYAYLAPISIKDGAINRDNFINGNPPKEDKYNRQRVYQGKSGYVQIDTSKLNDGFYERKNAASQGRKADIDYLEIKSGRVTREGLSKSDVIGILAPVPKLPKLSGSDRQISWAEAIREKAIRAGLSPEKAATKTEAKFWIDNRERLPGSSRRP